MDALYLTLLFLLGLIVGSFLNVVIIRTWQGKSLKGRSACVACKRMLKAFELVPLFSFIALRGKCRTCSVGLSWQYPAVELLTGLAFVGTAHMLGFSMAEAVNPLWWLTYIIHIKIWCLLIVIAFHDLETFIIPDKFVYSAALFAFLSTMITPQGFVAPSLETALSGPVIAAPLFLLWLVSRGRWIGLADSKLALTLGWLLGFIGGATALVLAFWIGAVISIALLVIQKYIHHAHSLLPFLKKELSLKSEIPFGPFLIIACAVVYFWGFNLISFLWM